jgi:hypothetical protein
MLRPLRGALQAVLIRLALTGHGATGRPGGQWQPAADREARKELLNEWTRDPPCEACRANANQGWSAIRAVLFNSIRPQLLQ